MHTIYQPLTILFKSLVCCLLQITYLFSRVFLLADFFVMLWVLPACHRFHFPDPVLLNLRIIDLTVFLLPLRLLWYTILLTGIIKGVWIFLLHEQWCALLRQLNKRKLLQSMPRPLLPLTNGPIGLITFSRHILKGKSRVNLNNEDICLILNNTHQEFSRDLS